jgi:hypothetical protein
VEEVGDIEYLTLAGKFRVRNLKFKFGNERNRFNHFFGESHGKILSNDLSSALLGRYSKCTGA